MNRREQLDKIFSGVDNDQKTIVNNLIDDVIFMEQQMAELKKLPFIRVHSSDKTKQEATPAAKQYKELSQAYMNALKILLKLTGSDVDGDDSDLRKYLKAMIK